MACTIKYKGTKFTESEFEQFIKLNVEEFADLLPSEMGKEILSAKYAQELSEKSGETTSIISDVAEAISDRISPELKSKISNRFGLPADSPLFNDAISREVIDSLVDNKSGEITDLAKGELIGAFASMTKAEIDNLQGLERALYNLSTGQKTTYKPYPSIKKSEIAFTNENGEWEVFNRQELFDKVKNGEMEMDDIYGLSSFIATEVINNDKANATYSNNIDYSKVLSDQEKSELTTRLMGVLSKLGFSTMKLSEYIKAYKLRTGVDPSVNALADMTNRIIAIAEGQQEEGLLSEEVAHVLTETYNNQDEIRAVLAEVENTETWKEHADTYFKLYESKGLTGEQLTEKVRREVLGKLIADKIGKPTPEPTTFISKVQGMVAKFFNSVNSYIRPSTKTTLEELTSKIADSILEEQKIDELYSAENLNTNPFSEFYNADVESALTAQLSSLVRDSRKLASKNKRGSLASKVDTLATMVADNYSDPYTSLQAVAQYLDITNSVKRDVMLKVKNYDEAVRAGNTPKSFLSSLDGASINILMTENLPKLQTLDATVRNLEPANHFDESRLKEFNILKMKVAKQVSAIIGDLNSLKGEVTLKDTISGKALLEELVVEYRATPEATEELRQYLTTVSKDISSFQGFFGNLQNANNPILALFGRLIGDIHHRTDVATKHYSRKFIDKLEQLGIPQERYQKFFDNLVQKTGDNKLTGYLKSVIDWGRFEKAKEANEIIAYNVANKIHIDFTNAKTSLANLVYEPITSLEEIGQSPNKPRVSDFTGEAKKEYKKIEDKWRDENLEQPYNKSFRQARTDMFEFIENTGITLPDGTVVKEIPDAVPEMMEGWASRRRDIKAPYMKDDVLDYSIMSEAERSELDSVKRQRLEAKSLVDPITGLDRTGDDLKIALALQAIEQYFIQNSTNAGGVRTIKDEFLKNLEGITDPLEAFEWFSKNSGITFNNNFWKKLDASAETSGSKFKAGLEKSDLPASEKAYILEKINDLENTLKRRSQFLKQFKNTSSPAEIDTSSMAQGAMETYVGMENTIEELFAELNTTLKEHTGVTVQDNITTESTGNDSFDRDYEEFKRENPNGTVIDFAQPHTTSKGKIAIGTVKDGLRRFKQTGEVAHTQSFRNAIIKTLNLSPDAGTAEIANALNARYAKDGSFDSLTEAFVKTKLVGYYKRFAPKGFTKFYEQMKTGVVKDSNGNSYSLSQLSSIIRSGNETGIKFENDIVNYMDLNPEVEWMQDESAMAPNVNFVKTTEGVSTNYGGYGQPLLSKYENVDFVNNYQIDKQIYLKTGETKSKGTSPEKQKELDLLEFLVHSRYDNFKQQGVQSIANAYSLPGVRKAAVEKTKDFLRNPVNGTREWYKDFIANSVDKKIYGESSTGEIDNDPTNIERLVVPLLNVQRLERLEDTTTDLLYSYTVHTYNSNLYRNRQDGLTKANQLEAMLLSRDFKDTAAKDSNAHKAFQDFKKAYLLGVHESKRIRVGVGNTQIDLTNILRTFDRALGTVNVGLNPAVSITAGTSALTFSVTESLVGQYMGVGSYKKGIARFHSKASSFINETGQVNKTNEVYLLGERFGLFGILNGVENSGESRFLREAFKDEISGMAHILTEVITKPFAPSVMYATLDTFRFVEFKNNKTGVEHKQLMSYDQFKTAYGGSDTTAEMESLWKSFDKNSVLNNVTVEKGMLKYSDNFENNIWGNLTAEEKEAAKNSMELDVRNTMSTIISRVDAKMPLHDKSAASRHALARFLLRHREWFTINFQARFKGAHNNLYTGQNEEGSYITLGRYVSSVTKALNPRNDTKLQDIYKTLTPTEKMNLRRVMIDTAISTILISMGLLVVSPWGDDDDNKDNWKVQFMAYMYYRLASEQMSSGVMGVPSYKDMLESPFVAVNSLKEIMKPSNYSTETVTAGPYEGHSKLFRLASKNTFTRHYFDLVHGLQQKSDFYRLNNEWTLWGMQKTSKAEKELQKKYEAELTESFMKTSERFMR